MKYPAYVLAGGRSTRLGQDKARAKLSEETTVLEAVVSSLSGLFSSWTVVADRVHKYRDLGFRTIGDHRPHQGPLGGILRAAQDAEDGHFFVVSCDRVGLEKSWVSLLEERLGSEIPALTFVADGRREPLFGFYHTAIIDDLSDALQRGDRAVWRFLDAIDAGRVEAPAAWSETIDLNTGDDLRRARRRWSGPHSSS